MSVWPAVQDLGRYPLIGLGGGRAVGAAASQGGSGIFVSDFMSGAAPAGMAETCASTRYRFNTSGVLVPVATDTTAFDYDPATGLLRGALIELQVTNLQTRSTPGTTGWTSVNAPTVTLNAGVSPDGGTNATQYAGTGVNQGQFGPSPAVASGTTYVQSLFLKNVSGASSIRTGSDNNPAGASIVSNLVAASITTNGGAVVASGIIPCANGWYRLWWAFVATGTTNSFVIYQNSAGNMTWQAWGATEEQGSRPTSFIPTAGSTATRQKNTQSWASVPNGIYARTVRMGTVSQAGTDYSDTVTVSGGAGYSHEWLTLPAAAQAVFERHVQRVTLRRTA
jgi:hypothetical protein